MRKLECNIAYAHNTLVCTHAVCRVSKRRELFLSDVTELAKAKGKGEIGTVHTLCIYDN